MESFDQTIRKTSAVIGIGIIALAGVEGAYQKGIHDARARAAQTPKERTVTVLEKEDDVVKPKIALRGTYRGS